MFSEITDSMKTRMKYLEEIDKRDREDGTEHLKRLRQISAETGRFIALLAANVPKEGEWIEIGTSAGYSTMWLSLAARITGTRIKTFETLEAKVQLAKETFEKAEIQGCVELVHGDFLKNYKDINRIALCFLDCEKHLYKDCFDIIAEKLIPGGLLVADNAINHYESLRTMMVAAESDARFDCLTVPIGKGEFICRRK